MSHSPREYYEAQQAKQEEILQTLTLLDRRLTFWRLAFFLGAGVCFIVAFAGTPIPWVWNLLGASLVIAFVVAARRHEWSAERREECEKLRNWHRESLARLDRRWTDIPDAEWEVSPEQRDLAFDLDLFGHASLFQLIDHTGTPGGQQMLANWLLEPSDPEVVAKRNQAVDELAPQRDLRESLALRCLMLSQTLARPDTLVAWSLEPAWRQMHPRALLVCRVLTPLFVVALVSTLLTWSGWAIGLLMLTVAANLAICVGWVGSIHVMFNRVSTRHREIEQYRELFSILLRQDYQAPRLVELREQISGDDAVLPALTRLAGIMSLASLRHAGLLAILHVILQVTLLWDVHVCSLVDRWKDRYGKAVKGWFDAVAEFEALASLSILRHDHPDWCFPEFSTEAKVVGTQMGHPLLSDAACVSNDVEVGPPGSVLLVTGSNMSGKSTLLRSIGVNAVLAQAGAPVCAQRFELPPLDLTTSMRVHDSLEDGVSFFMAELRRLKEIVDQAERHQRQGGRRLLYLLDEILQGTNSRERHIAVCRVVAHLIQHGAIGAITTHDLDLATNEQLESAICPVHFRETLGEDDQEIMTFDYQLRSGVATTTNALKLLSLVGLPDA